MKIVNATNQYDIFNLYKNKELTAEQKKTIYDARKENPELDRALYQADMAELHEEVAKTQQLARKLAKGEELTPEERKYLEEKNPDLLKKAEQARKQATELKQQLKNAKSAKQKQTIIGSAMAQVQQISKYDEVAADLMQAAYQDVINEDAEGEDKDTHEKDAHNDARNEMTHALNQAIKKGRYRP